MLGEERRTKTLERIRRLVAEIDPELHLHEVILDSTRRELAFVMQKGDQPFVIGMDWLDYVSRHDDELKQRIDESLKARAAAVEQRKRREEEEK
jgi:hypothetical protein